MRLIWRWFRLNWIEVAVSLVLIATSLAILVQPNFVAGALNAIRVPYAIIITLYTVFFFIRGNQLMITGGIIACLLVYPGIWMYFKPGQAPPNPKEQQIRKLDKISANADFSMVHFNVKENNKHLNLVVEDVISSDADILSLQEIKPEKWFEADSAILEYYPYSLISLDVPGFGIAIYSKQAFLNTKILTNFDFPVLIASQIIEDDTLYIIAATTSTPTSPKGYEKQQRQFPYLLKIIDSIPGAKILAGDLNAVPWSEQIELLTNSGGLEDSRKDLSATYPAQSVWVQIPIDYILHSKHLNCVAFTTLEANSSNHLGIMGYYTFRKKEP